MMFKNKFALIGIVVAMAIVLSGCSLLKGYSGNSSDIGTGTEGSTEEAGSDKTSTEASESVTIIYSDDGFSPSPTKVKSGGSIIWVNESTKTVQVGSAQHPAHTVNQEITNDQFVIELAPGESSDPVIVTKAGEWGYHNHLNASKFGKVIVQ